LKAAFVDTSALAALLFDEPSSSGLSDILVDLEWVYASPLLEAEIRSAAARENLEQSDVDAVLSRVKWVQPDRPLTQEMKSIVSAGLYLRGADLWHLACALYLAGDPSVLPFVTLDGAQAEAAARLGFQVLPGRERGLEIREAPAGYGLPKRRAGAKRKKGLRTP
jgi:predicted nucleic acid-binding protein